MIKFAIALEDFARSLRDRDRHDRAILTGPLKHLVQINGTVEVLKGVGPLNF